MPSAKKILSRRELLRAGACGLCVLGCFGFKSFKSLAQTTTSEPKPPERGLVKPRPSPWFSRLEGSVLKCELCPEACKLEAGQRAKCRVRKNRDGQGYTLAFGNPALVQEDPVERLPFFHVLPGSQTLAVATAGCNLACKFCEVWDMALVDPEDVHAYDLPPENLVQHVQESGLSSVSFAFGEPVIFYEYMFKTAQLAKEAGLKNLMHTAGYIRKEPVMELIPFLDGVNVDLKGFDQDFYREAVGGDLQPVLETLKLFKSQGVHMEITNILIPTLNDDLGQIKTMCSWIAEELGPDVPLHFARFYPLYELSHLPQTPVSDLDQARETAQKAGLDFVYVARVTGHAGENTFCPQCGAKIIERTGFIVDHMDLQRGKCGQCQSTIPGKWN